MRILLGTERGKFRARQDIPYAFVCSKCLLIHRGVFKVKDEVIWESLKNMPLCAGCFLGKCPCSYCGVREKKSMQ